MTHEDVLLGFVGGKKLPCSISEYGIMFDFQVTLSVESQSRSERKGTPDGLEMWRCRNAALRLRWVDGHLNGVRVLGC